MGAKHITGRRRHTHMEPHASQDGLSMRSLAALAEGFGAQAKGGLDGPVFVVTSLAGECLLEVAPHLK